MLKEKILEQLKTKYKQLGLSAKILEGFATRLAKTVTEEDKIEEAVNDVEPELQIWQSVLDANRKEVADLKKQLADKKAEPAKGDDPKPTDNPKQEPKPDDTPEWAKALMSEVQALKSDKVITTRKSQYESILKDVKDEKMKANKLAAFDRYTFKDDEDYNSFIESEKQFLSDFTQQQAAESLKTGRPMVSQQSSGKMSDIDSKTLAKKLVKSIY